MIVDFTALKSITNLNGQTCFGCGVDNPIGLRMEFRTDGQRVYSLVSVPPAMAGWDQTVHGGILSTILDEIMGWTVISLLGKIGVTKSMTVEFVKPVRVGQNLTVVGAIEEICSERQVLVSGAIYSDEERVCAQARGTFAAMTAETAVRLGVMSPAYKERFMPILRQNQGA